MRSTKNVNIVIEYKTSNIPICFRVVVFITSVVLRKQRFFVPLRKQEIEIPTLFVGYNVVGISSTMLKKLCLCKHQCCVGRKLCELKQ